MPVYPTPRLLVLLILGVFAAIGVGLLAPAMWAWVPLAMVAVLALGLVDAVFAPAGDSLVLDVTLPKTIGVGRDRTVPFTLHFTRWRQPGVVELRAETNAVLAGSAYERVLRRSDSRFNGTLTLKSRTRGRGRLDALFVRWQGALGLVYIQKRVKLDAEVVVTPDIEGVEADASDLFSLDSIYGVRVHNQLYNGSEYHALREYDASQDHRRIDWRSSARHMKLFSREYQAERNHHIVLAYDTGRLMGEPLAGLKRLDRAIHAGLLLGYCALKIGDNIRTFAFDSQPYHAAPMISGTQAFDVLKRQLSALEDSPDESNHTLALADLNSRVARRSARASRPGGPRGTSGSSAARAAESAGAFHRPWTLSPTTGRRVSAPDIA